MIKLLVLLVVFGALAIEASGQQPAFNKVVRSVPQRTAARRPASKPARPVQRQPARPVQRQPARPVQRQPVRPAQKQPVKAVHRPTPQRQPVKTVRKPAARRPARPATRTNVRKPNQRRSPQISSLRTNPRRRDAGSCVDNASNCHSFRGLCTNPNYRNLLRQHCSRFCGYCSAAANDCRFVKYNSKCLPIVCARPDEWRSPECVAFCNIPRNQHTTACRASTDCNKNGNAFKPTCKEKSCALDANLFKPECLQQTCAKADSKAKSECQTYCSGDGKSTSACKCDAKENQNASWCSNTKPKSECSKDDKKYEPQCLETTCGIKEEKEKTTGKCLEYCAPKKANTNSVCTCASKENKDAVWCKSDSVPKTPKDCDKDENKYTDDCAQVLCSKKVEKQNTTSTCVFSCKKPNLIHTDACNCDKAENKNIASWCVDPECTSKTDSVRHQNKCIEYICAKEAEKTTQWCRDKCTESAHSKKDACNCDNIENHNAGAPWCPVDPECGNMANPAKRYKDGCIKTVCAEGSEKLNEDGKCKDKCPNAPFDSLSSCSCDNPLNSNGKANWCPSPDCNSDDEEKRYQDSCIRFTCAKPEEKQNSNGECEKKCREGDNLKLNACSCKKTENMNEAASWCPKPAPKNCHDPTHSDYYTAKCFEHVCIRKAELMGMAGATGCNTACKLAANKNKKGCKCSDRKLKNGQASWCLNSHANVCNAANRNTVPCLAVRCSDPGEQNSTECTDYCKKDTNGNTANDGEGRKKGDTLCTVSDETNKFAPWFIKATCDPDSEESEIPWGACYQYCKNTPADCTCADLTDAAFKPTDYCLSEKCTVGSTDERCIAWCEQPENINRPKCVS